MNQQSYKRIPSTPSDKAAGVDEVHINAVFGPWRHVIYASVFLLSSIILVSVSHSTDLERRLDFVTLFDYTKAITDKSSAISDIKKILDNSAWLNTNSEECLDMSTFGYPVVSFKPENDPTSSTCQISFSVKQGQVEGQVRLDAIYTGVTIDCPPGQYTLAINGGSGQVAEAPVLTITGGMGTSNPAGPSLELSVSGSFGFDYANFNQKFIDCRNARQAVATSILEKTACEHPISSPMCACVQTFTSRLTAWNGKLIRTPAPGVNLKKVLSDGVERCVDLRRAHDVREPVAKSYARSRVLLLFAVALFFNALHGAIMPSVKSMWLHILVLLVYFLTALLACLLNADKGESMSESFTTLAILIPAFFVHGSYGILLRFSVSLDEGRLPIPAPFLHPITFDLCLCALTLFTLVERGVVQSEYLVVEILKCHAVAAIYIAVTWYHRHGPADNSGVFATEAVQQAYFILFVVGLAASLAPTVVPYPAKKCFEMHWLLPGAFTYLAFSNPSWAQSLQFSQHLLKGAEKSGNVLYGFNEIAGVFALLFGAVLWAYFLQDHLQVYGSSHFSYLPPTDPLAAVSMRMIE